MCSQTHLIKQAGESFPIDHLVGSMVRLSDLTDGDVEVGPVLGFVLGLEEVADAAEAGAARNQRIRSMKART